MSELVGLSSPEYKSYTEIIIQTTPKDSIGLPVCNTCGCVVQVQIHDRVPCFPEEIDES